MQRKTESSGTPSPKKKRRLETTPVKHSLEFFFAKQAQTPPRRVKEESTFSATRGTEDVEIQRLKQELADEKLARELQELETASKTNDEQFARQLDEFYHSVDGDSTITDEPVTPIKNKKYSGKDLDTPTPDRADKSNLERMNSLSPLAMKVAGKSTEIQTSLKEICAIPLDKDPLAFDPAVDAACADSWSPQKTPYAFLTHAFILINSTRSRLKMVDYLVNTLRVVIHHDPLSLLPLVWLTTNAIAPPFKGVELNIGGSVISKALQNASGLTSAALKALYDKHGDIGDVAFEAKMSVRTLMAPTPLTVKGVYSVLRNIAAATGKGSVDTKRRLVERLLVSARGEELRYIARTLVQHVNPHSNQG
jgi:DNA ligase 1